MIHIHLPIVVLEHAKTGNIRGAGVTIPYVPHFFRGKNLESLQIRYHHAICRKPVKY